MANGNSKDNAIGYVKFTQGVVLAINELGQVRALLPGDYVYQGETVLTGVNGFAILGGFTGAALFISEDKSSKLSDQVFNDIPITQLQLTENLGINDFFAKLFTGTLSESLATPELFLPQSFQSEALAVLLNTDLNDLFGSLMIDSVELFEPFEANIQDVKDNLEKLGVRLENFANLADNLLDVADLSGIETPPIIFTSSSDNVINGTAGDDILFGSNGNDIINGGAGNDFIEGGPGADLINGGAGNDTASYANSNMGVFIDLAQRIFAQGDAQGDVLFNIENLLGSMFNDNLIGDDNNNILTTGGGADLIISGAGNDIFKSFATDTDSDTDNYVDFSAADDTLDISELLDNYNASTDDINDFVNIQSNGDVNVDADGPGAGGQQTIANLATTPGSGTVINVIGEAGTTEQVTVA